MAWPCIAGMGSASNLHGIGPTLSESARFVKMLRLHRILCAAWTWPFSSNVASTSVNKLIEQRVFNILKPFHRRYETCILVNPLFSAHHRSGNSGIPRGKKIANQSQNIKSKHVDAHVEVLHCTKVPQLDATIHSRRIEHVHGSSALASMRPHLVNHAADDHPEKLFHPFQIILPSEIPAAPCVSMSLPLRGSDPARSRGPFRNGWICEATWKLAVLNV